MQETGHAERVLVSGFRGAALPASPPVTSPVIVIPAYQPAISLPSLAADLAALGFPVVVVNDGSSPQSAGIFERCAAIPRVAALHHNVNRGKGAALRTGLQEALRRCPDASGVVTADADGQHRAADVAAVAARLAADGRSLVLGARSFKGSVPWRSLAGNLLTRLLLRFLVGQKLRDTQTGLRGIPAFFIASLLQLPSTGYEFELDMLVLARRLAVPIVELPVETVYLDGNASSHFQPLRDSMKVYFVLFRHTLLSLAARFWTT